MHSGSRDITASLGGDEFAILLPSLADKHDIDRVIGKIRTALHEPFTVHDLPVNVEARLGIALYPTTGSSADLLWQRADIALCAAKELHRSWVVYEPDIDHYDPGRLALIGGLRTALEQNELVLHFQPSIDLGTGRIRGVEALLRWRHPDRGLIYPDEFIPLAERTGLIDALTGWVVASALRQGHDWHSSGVSLDVAVNISVRNLQAPGFCNEILDLARSSGFPLEQLSLEITESAIMADPERARSVLRELYESGIRLSVDDFGTGQSSLAYVRDLPVSTIKIDKSFVIDFKQSRNAAIVSTAIDLGHNLGMTVTAEGVEDEETWRMLRDLGCDVAQGYFFSRPLTVDQLAGWLAESPWGPAPA
ncbi:MAG: bifunctional diguanylate cyclase/phosphodiesterase [Gammaproteobacteria bacterium]|nr:bifunctional diguanylate cyclase/phosphodiesterase [Gammaproteobacteria bacterium]